MRFGAAPAAIVAAVLAISTMLAPPVLALKRRAPAATAWQGVRTDTLVDGVAAAWFRAEWRRYADRFVTPDGRVVDNANGDISHSEGQGYGLLLAARTGDADRFATLWTWTSANLMVRQDGLAAWSWDPRTRAVADPNNATDGDILIAWALWDAARRFDRPDYRKAAVHLAQAIGAHLVMPGPLGPILLPAVKGFGAGEQPDGPVVNLSYWVLPALAALKDLAPATDWDGVRKSGAALLDASRFGPYGLPAEWESVAGPWPRPAKGFAAAFGYNAIRIPLYLAMAGDKASTKVLRRFAGAWTQAGTTAQLVEIKAAVAPPIDAPGYALIFALARCAATGQVIAPETISTRSDLYYPETLRLLAVVALQERYPACL